MNNFEDMKKRVLCFIVILIAIVSFATLVFIYDAVAGMPENIVENTNIKMSMHKNNIVPPIKELDVIYVDMIDYKNESEKPVEEEPKYVVNLTRTPYDSTASDIDLLACVIYQEAGQDSCSDDTRIMVGNVVMNRVNGEGWPNTIYNVLIQERQYGLYYWTGIKWPDKAFTDFEKHAVERAYEAAYKVLNGEKLLEDDYVWQAEFVQGWGGFWQDDIYFGRY